MSQNAKPLTKSLMNRLLAEIKEELKDPEVKLPNSTEEKLKYFFKQAKIVEDAGINYANLYELTNNQLKALKKAAWELKKLAFLIRRDRQHCREMLIKAKEKLLELGHIEESDAIQIPEYQGINTEMRPFKRPIANMVKLDSSESESEVKPEAEE